MKRSSSRGCMGKEPSHSNEEGVSTAFPKSSTASYWATLGPKIRSPFHRLGFFRREGVTGGGPASGDSAQGAYGARAPGRSDLTGSATKGLRAQQIS